MMRLKTARHAKVAQRPEGDFAPVDRQADAAPATSGEKRLLALSFGVALGYLGAFFAMFLRRQWVLDAAGRPQPMDFLGIWSAGRLALTGAAPSAYDVHLQHAAQVAAIGHDFPYS
jgi:hypothetical protein